ncbi:MAG TPA: hypothetical protein VNA14_12090, partial [Mycobacteriales bacterium]|nr:hypothetical protein [Mycobacteriales bacterium]
MRLLRIELKRLRSRRAVRWLTLLVFAGLGALGTQGIYDASRPGATDWVFVVRMDEASKMIAVLLSVYAFLVGATYAGADWAAGTVQSLLTWEPRRVRVIVAKVVALTVGVLLVGVLLHLVITGIVTVAADRGGNFDGIDGDFWRRQLLADARALGLGVAIGWVSFGIASLTRNTGVALGFGFVYFAIL